jgi:hypothetical protein
MQCAVHCADGGAERIRDVVNSYCLFIFIHHVALAGAALDRPRKSVSTDSEN